MNPSPTESDAGNNGWVRTIELRNLPFKDGTHHCTPSRVPGQQFSARFFGHGQGGRYGTEVSDKLFIINDIYLSPAQRWEWPRSLRAQNWLVGALVEPGWLRVHRRGQEFFPLWQVGKQPGTTMAIRGETSGAV
jgi:hypothetical protein